MDTKRWRVGELARTTGLTVRTLHHYDELGVVSPSERTTSGYRSYTPADVERLYRVVALRGLGFQLAEIRDLLDTGSADALGTVRRQLEVLDRRIAEMRTLRRRLDGIVQTLEGNGKVSTEDLLDAIGRTTMVEKYYSPEQLEQLEQRRTEMGDHTIRNAEREWAELIAAVEAERQAGTNPSDPKLAPLIERWTQLIEVFTGGDPGIRASLQRMYEQEGPRKASQGAVSSETMAYAQQAIEAHTS